MKTDEEDTEFAEFERHLKETAEEVRRWPDWKLLGAKATMGFAAYGKGEEDGA